MSPPDRKASSRGGTPSTPASRPDLERAELLRDVVTRAAASARDEQQSRPRAPSRRRGAAIGFALLAVAFAAYSLVARPEFLWGPRGSLLPPAVSEASARVSMAILSTRIEEYERTYGHLPESLAALGEPGGIVGYRLEDDSTWVLTASEGGKPIELRRGASVRAFVGDALPIVRAGTRR